MRIFTAIPLPKKTRDMVGEITRGRLPIPYINTTNLHITLNFFGELTDPELEKIKQNFLQFTSNQEAFNIEFEAITKFRNQLHMTIATNTELNKLQGYLEKQFQALGYKFQDHEYYAHVKLGNLHMDNVMNQQRKVENFPKEELRKLSFRAETITLYESKLLLHHPKYIPLMEQKLL